MSGIIFRRELVKGVAGTGATGALALVSRYRRVFATPNMANQTGSNVNVTF